MGKSRNKDKIKTKVKSKSKSKSPKKRARSKKTKRDPYHALDERGIEEIELANKQAREDALKKFGPCNFDAHECYTAILMLLSEEDHIVIGALHCLEKFLKKRLENAETLEALKGISALIRHINSPNRVIQRLAMKCLSLSTRVHPSKLTIRNLGLVGTLMELARSEDEIVQEYATAIISNLATLYTGRLQLIQNEIVPMVLELLEHPDPDVVRNSAEIIWRILVDSLNTDLFLSEEAASTILNLTLSEYPPVQVLALSILQKLSGVPQGVTILAKIGSLDRLEKIVGEKELGDLHRVGLKILINMVESPQCCKKMAPFLGPAVGLVSDTPDVKTLILALVLVGKLSRIRDSAKTLIDMGFFPRLLELLACDNMKIVEAAITAAAAITSTDNMTTKKLLLNGMESLLDCLDANELKRESYEKALETLGQLLTVGKEASHLFLEWGGRETLLKILKAPENYTDDALISTLSCIQQLSRHWSIRKFVSDDEIIRSILGTVQAKPDPINPQILTAAGGALGGILCEPGASKCFMDSEGYSFLQKLVTHEEEPVKHAALAILTIFVSIPEGIAFLLSNGMLEELYKSKRDVQPRGFCNDYSIFTKLLNCDKSSRFSLTGHLDAFEPVPDGFYNVGVCAESEIFMKVDKIEPSEETREKKIIYVNLTDNFSQELVLKNPIFTAAMGSSLQQLIEQLQSDLSSESLTSELEAVSHVARIVSEQFGGPFQNQWRIGMEMEELEFATLQTDHKSTIIPLSMIKVGAHRPRALLFKILAQALGIPCTLERGHNGKYWNVIFSNEDEEAQVSCICSKSRQPETRQSVGVDSQSSRRQSTLCSNSPMGVPKAVDLIYEPGRLIPLDSREWELYSN